MTLPNNEVSADSVFELANQLSNPGSHPETQPNAEEQRVPYDRFKEVNDERKNLADQNQKLMELVSNFQAMQQQAQQPQTPVAQAPQVQPLFTDDELNSFEQDIVLDPKSTLQRFGDAILKRGVEARVSQVEKTFEEKFAAFTAQQAAQQAPTIVENFKRSRFSAQDTAEIAAFDQALKSVDPSLVTNPATLENIRLAAIGFVADQRRSQPQQNQGQFFTETPGGAGGLPGGFGGLLGTQQASQVPPQVAAVAAKMGLKPEEANAMYQAMDRSGVFRTN